MKIVITGATGFVGGHLVRHFAKKGHSIIAVGRQKCPPSRLLQYANWLQADLTKSIPKIDCDICIHAAGLASDSAFEAAFFAANVLGTKHIFEAVTAPIFIHISSGSVYPNLIKPLNEEDASLKHDLSNYGKSKLLAEQFLEKNAKQKKSVTVFRPRAIYGTNDRVLLPRILELVKFGNLVFIGDAQISISMTHISNLIQGIEQAINIQLTKFQIFNIADDKIYQLNQVLKDLVFGIYDREIPISKFPVYWAKVIANFFEKIKIHSKLNQQSLNYMTQSTTLDLSKIQTHLGYQTITDFNNELKNITNWVGSIGLENILKKKVDLVWG